MLGGPPPTRESAAPPQYSPAASTNNPGPPPYGQSLHASPRAQSTTVAEYASYRRPQTPEHHRMYESRNPRAATAASPPAYSSTPEVPRYGTPQTYPQRAPPLPLAEQAREPGRLGASTVPPRPASPQKPYPGVGPPRPAEPPRPPAELYAHREELRPSEEYNPERPIRVMKYDEQRFMSDRERQERERHEREAELRERERRDMAMSGVEPQQPQQQQPHGMHPQDYARHVEQRPPAPPYSRPPDPREQAHWPRPSYEPARAPYDPAMHIPRHQDYPPSTAPHYNGPHPYAPAPVDRHHPAPHPHHQHSLPPPGPAHPQSYGSPDRQRMNAMPLDRSQPQHPPPRTREETAVPPPSVAYGNVGPSMYESARNRPMEDMGAAHGHQRGLLAVQEINRKGRISPLPQAVQGAQPQLAGPTGEPGIKSEFGRMFSGIGTGVGALSSPVPAGSQVAYGGSSLHRRDDGDGTPEESAVEPTKAGREPARGKRRRLKEDDAREDDGSTGRLTPVGNRAKKAKSHGHHHHQYV